MAKKSFLLVAALAVLVLGTACENNGGGGGAPSSYTVTFMRNNPDPDSGPEKVTVTVPAGEKIGDKLPNSQFPTVEEGWDAGYGVTGWHTSADGTGGKRLTTGTTIDEDWTVYAQWGYGESQKVDASGNLIVIAPEITQGGDMHGTYNGTPNANGSITWSSGGIRWMYPTESENYDYVEIYYIGKGATPAATSIPNNILKQYNTTTDYMPETGTQYPTLNLSGVLKFKVKYGGGGIAIQIYEGQERTMKFTRAVFTKGTRYPITFDLDFANAPKIPDTFGVLNFELGSLPLPYPPASPSGKSFNGWVISATGASVTDKSIITGPLNLKATWIDAVPVSQIDVNFTTASLTAMGGSSVTIPATGETGNTSYTFTYGTGSYTGSWAKFTITLEASANLAAYKEVTFKYKSESGDTDFKPFALLAAASLGTGFSSDPHTAGSPFRINTDEVQVSTTTEWKEAKFTIDKSKASALKNTIEFCIYDHSAAAKDGAPTSWSIKDLSFIPE